MGAAAMRGSAEVEVFRDPDALMQAAAAEFVRIAAEATLASGRFVVALAGGSSPAGLYDTLAADPYARQIDWARVHVFWGDERCVPPGHPASNYRVAREHLLDRVPVPAGNVHRIHGEDDPAAAALAYEQELRETFATREGPPRPAPGARFDLVLLGMGDDGHTASLFPGTAAVRERERWVVAHHVAAASMWRISLTPVVIDTAAEVAFLVVGHEKATTLRRVLEGPYQPEALPAQAIAPHAGRLRWLVWPTSIIFPHRRQLDFPIATGW
jgi:6-phosphogluconolactonase